MQISTLLNLLFMVNVAQAATHQRPDDNQVEKCSGKFRGIYVTKACSVFSALPVSTRLIPTTSVSSLTTITTITANSPTTASRQSTTNSFPSTEAVLGVLTSQTTESQPSSTFTRITSTSTLTSTLDSLTTSTSTTSTQSTTIFTSLTTTQAPEPTYSNVALSEHNIHRSNHSFTGSLFWDTEIAGYAQTTASSCVYQHDTFVSLINFSTLLQNS